MLEKLLVYTMLIEDTLHMTLCNNLGHILKYYEGTYKDMTENLQNLLKEPVKFLKNPALNFMAIKAIKDPSYSIWLSPAFQSDLISAKISKDSIEYIESHKEPLPILKKDSLKKPYVGFL